MSAKTSRSSTRLELCQFNCYLRLLFWNFFNANADFSTCKKCPICMLLTVAASFE
jgi:hypothetical protein